MLASPEKVVGRNLVFMINNIAVMYSWLSGCVKNDSSALEVLKKAQYMAAFLGITVHVKHVPRMLDNLARIAGELSKKESGFNGKTARALAGKPLWRSKKKASGLARRPSEEKSDLNSA